MGPIRTAVCTVVLGLLAVGCGGTAANHPQAAETTAPTAVPPTPVALPAVQLMEDVPHALAIFATPEPDWIVTTYGVAWVANVDHGIARYGRNGHKLGVVPTTGDICLAMDQGFGSVWAVDCDAAQVVRMDARTGKVQARIPLTPVAPAGESSLAVGAEGVFLLDSAGSGIAQVDPGTNRLSERRLPAPDQPSAIRLADGSLWVTSASTGTVSRIDPASGAVTAEIATKAGIRFLTHGQGAIWVMNNDEAVVYRIDPATNKIAATIGVGARIDGGDIVFGGGSVWARVADSLVNRIDPATNSVVARFGAGSGSGSVAADGTTLWISAHELHTVWRVSLR